MSYYNKKNVTDINVTGKRVIVRVDFNVPFDTEGNISDDKRIVAALPTIKYLLDKKAKVILMSHLGRPKGQFNMKYSMASCSKHLGKLLNMEVIQSSDVIGPDSKEKAKNLKEGQILMLENVR
nr:phosphoglycerate kinase [Clostridia bacterium]